VIGGSAARAISHTLAGSTATSLAATLGGVEAEKQGSSGPSVAAPAGGGADASAGLAQAGASAAVTAAPAAATTAALQVHASVDSAEFAQGLADRVSWMIGNGVNGAKLQVNPPQLGPIELSISVQGNHALVAMTTHSAVTREALESSSPKLREMLSAQGFGQVSVDISQRSFQDRSAFSRPYGQSSSGERSAATAAAPAASIAAQPRASVGALDAYA